MDGKSLDMTAEKKAQLKQLFPDVFSEEQIDWERLRLCFGEEVFVQGEHYELSWAGKAEARKEIQKQTTATLNPDREHSVNFDASDNIFIAGENLDVLRILQKSYFGKIKMIYIDPPYNTGNDSFVYPDDYAERREEYELRAGITDERGFLNKQDLWKKNTKENGQFHSVWLSMMYPRLYLARNLLREDGVMFVSIDDNEQATLKLLMDEIFGEENFVAAFIWEARSGKGGTISFVSNQHEYVLCYSKNMERLNLRMDVRIKKGGNYEDEKGKYFREQLRQWGQGDRREDRPSMYFPISYKAIEIYPKRSDGADGRWRFGKKTVEQMQREGDLDFVRENDSWNVYRKIREGKQSISATDSLLRKLGTSATGTIQLKEFFGEKVFDTTKPTDLIKYLINLVFLDPNSDELILDFFAGSGTTAQAVLELNQEDGGNRKFLLIQLPEALDESSEACKAGYKTIADISRARITKVIEKLEAVQQAELDFGTSRPDLGFKAYTLNYSNFKVWRSDVEGKDPLLAQLDLLREPLAEYRGDNAALLTELCLKAGLPLSIDIQERHFEGCRIYDLGQGMMWIALEHVNLPLFRHIADAKPSRFVTLGNLFSGEHADEIMSNATLQLQEAGVEFKII